MELTTFVCRKHLKRGQGESSRQRDVRHGTVGMVIAAVLYLFLNLFGASNRVPFFSSGNIVFVLLAGFATLAVGAILGEWLGRLTSHQPDSLPPPVRIYNEDASTLVFEFLHQACADNLQAQIRADETKP